MQETGSRRILSSASSHSDCHSRFDSLKTRGLLYLKAINHVAGFVLTQIPEALEYYCFRMT